MSSTPESEYDDWWSSEHPNGTGEFDIESDCDECVEDRFDDYEADEI
jgi:hypothetical protein